MAGLFDLHMLYALKKGWSSLANDSGTTFSTYFEGVESDVRLEWYKALFPDDKASFVEFRPAFVPQQTKLPCVIVQYTDEPEEMAPLGYWGGATVVKTKDPDTGLDVFTKNIEREQALLLRESAIINIIAPHPELLRALHIALLSVGLSNRQALWDLGYVDLEYLGASDTSIEEGLMPNDLGAFMRTQRWRARSQIEISTDNTVAAPDILIASSDVTVDGKAGGVTGDQETNF